MVRERAMLAVMAALKDKPDWERKVLDETIVAKWRHEALKVGEALQQEAPDPWGAVQQGMSMNAPARQKEISGAMFDYVSPRIECHALGG